MEPIYDEQPNKSIYELIGELTDFQTDSNLSNLDQDKIDKLKVQRGDFVEKYFAQKLKFLLKADSAISNFIDLQEVHDDFILSINYVLIKEKNNPEIKNEKALAIIEKIDKSLKDESAIQMDTVLPSVSGKELLSFFETMKEYSYPSNNNIEPNKKYTIIVESTFNLYSQIYDKAEQLRKNFLLISLLNDLYIAYPIYIENYYKYFIWRYLLGNKAEKTKIDENKIQQINLSDYANYIFVIASNKTLKKFQETRELVDYITFDKEEDPGKLIKKCFAEDNAPIPPKLNISSHEKKNISIPKNASTVKGFKEMNYLITKINQQANKSAKLIFMDSYLNLITPKCVLGEKLIQIEEAIKKKEQEMNEKMKKLDKELKSIEDLKLMNEGLRLMNEDLKLMNKNLNEENKELMDFLKKKFPDFKSSKLK